MQLSFATLFLAVTTTVSAAPAELERRAAATCGSQYYSATQVNSASVTACNHFKAGTALGGYPHRYNNYEGFNFKDYSGPFQEFPILSSGSVYTGGLSYISNFLLVLIQTDAYSIVRLPGT